MNKTDSTNSKFMQWSSALNWICKIGLLGFSLTLYNGKSDIPIENEFVFGFLIIVSIGIESLLRLYSAKREKDLISIEISGAVSSVSILLTIIFLDQISDATSYKMSLPAMFIIAFSFSYSICFLYLRTYQLV